MTLTAPAEGAQPRWYALTVKPRHEKAATAYLDRKGLEAYLPLYRVRRRWSDRMREVEMCLFPGYVFCRFPFASRLDVLNAPSVHSIVGFGDREVPVAQEEIDSIRAILASGARVLPWEYLKVGERVRIIDGSLRDVEGILVRERDAWRVVVGVELLQRSVAVEIDRDLVRPVR
jgi:transcription antitermination factor NusG